jgi:hypothetical protein
VIHDTIRTAVTALVGGRYYPNRFPQEAGAPTWPAIRGTVISRDNAIDQCGAGTDDDDDILVQIDICAETYTACAVLATAVRTALAAVSLIRQPGAFETWDAEAKVHRFVSDFTLYQSTPT